MKDEQRLWEAYLVALVAVQNNTPGLDRGEEFYKLCFEIALESVHHFGDGKAEIAEALKIIKDKDDKAQPNDLQMATILNHMHLRKQVKIPGGMKE